MTPQGLRHTINLNLKPIVTRCPKCKVDQPPDRVPTVPDPITGIVIWWVCLDCLARADARLSAMQGDEIPQWGRNLIRQLWHYLTMQRPTQDEVDAVAGDVRRALGQQP